MKVPYHCTIFYQKSRHLNQLYTGFYDLEKKGLIQLDVVFSKAVKEKSGILRAQINGANVIYDAKDGLNWTAGGESEGLSFFKTNYDEVDYYFKRSYTPFLNGMIPGKIFPLGLNYSVSPDNFFSVFKQNEWKVLSPSIKKMMISMLNLNETSIKSSEIESLPKISISDYPPVIFFARLWEPDKGDDQAYKDELNSINQSRIENILKCRETFGDRFIGGLYDDRFTRRLVPELVVTGKITKKRNYLRLMKKASICIATTGLHKSIGWKMGEYVAASKAIITEPLNYTVPGDFSENKNYLNFSSSSELTEKIDYLLSNPDEIFNMMCNNYFYYHKYLKPENLILNSLLKIPLLR